VPWKADGGMIQILVTTSQSLL